MRKTWAALPIFMLTFPFWAFGQAENTPETPETCWQTGVVQLTAAQTKAQLRYTAPINGPALWRQMRIGNAVLVFKIRTNENGDVECVRAISGHPIMIASVIGSLKNWKFRPKKINGRRCPIYGTLVLQTSCCKASKTGLEVKVLNDEPPKQSNAGRLVPSGFATTSTWSESWPLLPRRDTE